LVERGLIKPYEKRFLADLITIDIERSWMAWNRWLPTRHTDANPDQVMMVFDFLPTMEAYIELLGDVSPKAGYWNDIAESEYAARHEWGDSIGVEHYRRKFGLELRCDMAKSTHHVRIGWRSRHEGVADTQSFPLRGRLTIGRRRSCDPIDQRLFEFLDGQRLVVAERTENNISREQLWVQLLNPKLAAICNTGNSPMEFSKNLLPSNKKTLAEFPFTIEIDGKKLFFG